MIRQNCAAIDRGAQASVRRSAFPTAGAAWPDLPPAAERPVPPVVEKLLRPINRQKGDDLPVSAFLGYEDGEIDMGLTAYEKRNIAVKIPKWNQDRCIQCNRCSLVCPHAVIRPYLLNDAENEKTPEGFVTVPAKGRAKGLSFSLQVSEADCTGCGVCVHVPGQGQGLTMVPAQDVKPDDLLGIYPHAVGQRGRL